MQASCYIPDKMGLQGWYSASTPVVLPKDFSHDTDPRQELDPLMCPILANIIQAQQYAYHPMLVELKFETAALGRAMRRNEGMDTTEQGDQEATDQLIKWKKKLEQDENWLSQWVMLVLDVVDKHKNP